MRDANKNWMKCILPYIFFFVVWCRRRLQFACMLICLHWKNERQSQITRNITLTSPPVKTTTPTWRAWTTKILCNECTICRHPVCRTSQTRTPFSHFNFDYPFNIWYWCIHWWWLVLFNRICTALQFPYGVCLIRATRTCFLSQYVASRAPALRCVRVSISNGKHVSNFSANSTKIVMIIKIGSDWETTNRII